MSTTRAFMSVEVLSQRPDLSYFDRFMPSNWHTSITVHESYFSSLLVVPIQPGSNLVYDPKPRMRGDDREPDRRCRGG